MQFRCHAHDSAQGRCHAVTTSEPAFAFCKEALKSPFITKIIISKSQFMELLATTQRKLP